jgi:cytochrome c oxidase subunit 2
MLTEFLGIVENASEHGYQIDHMIEFVHWLMAALFIGWGTFFTFTLIRFHKSRHPVANYYGARSKVSTHLEFIVVLVEAVLLLGFAIPIWGKRVNGPKPTEDALRIRVIGEQYLWNFHYAGKDGVFGSQKAELVNSANAIGLDPMDPASHDDIVAKNEMHLPVNKSVILEITSKDVIHSFSMQAMRMGQDAIPGTRAPVWFKPVKTGTFEVICGQLCGGGHYAMRSIMVVDSAEDFATWMSEMEQLKASSAPAVSSVLPDSASAATLAIVK